MKFLQTLIATLLIGSAIVIAIQEQPQPNSMSEIIHLDFEKLQNEDSAKKFLKKLKRVHLQIHTKDEILKQKLKNSLALVIQTKENGPYSMLIDVIPDPTPSENLTLLLQYNIFDNETWNKVFETSRNYEFTYKDLEESQNPN